MTKGGFNLATISSGGSSNPGYVDDDHSVAAVEKKDPNVEVGEDEDDDDDGTGKKQWGNQIEFLLSCISMSVGLGNIWRFPFTCYDNGGGAFLIPYIIVLLTVGRPLYYMEMCIGQFAGFANIRSWNICPAFRGVGIGQGIASAVVATYYAAIMSLTVFYFIMSFFNPLPWTHCDSDWADNTTCISHTNYKKPCARFPNNTIKPDQGECDKRPAEILQSSTDQFFRIYVTKTFDTDIGVDEGLGMPDWKLVLCAIFCWTFVCFSLIKGVDSIGKVAYFTAIFPYIILFTLLGKGCSLNGAVEGIKYFVTPQWEKLYKPKVWFAAIGQMFFSLDVGFGGIIMYSSFNNFRHNAWRDINVISCMDTFTSFIAGLCTFAILGNLSKELGQPIHEIIESGVGLAFIGYPDAIGRFEKLPQLFSALFFVMFFTLGAGTSMAQNSIAVTNWCDYNPSKPLKDPARNRSVVTIIVCTVGFLVGIIYTTPGGQYILQLFDFFAGSFVIMILMVFEITGIMWIYGMNRWCNDVEFMTGRRPGLYWKFCWGYFIPILLIVVLLYSFAVWEPLVYGDDYLYPWSVQLVGWVLFTVIVGMVPCTFIITVYQQEGDSLAEKIKASFRPVPTWGPKVKKLRKSWREFHADHPYHNKMGLFEGNPPGCGC